jgi:VIT1/CCC1 family predicted Fe2+/Mn2+ transporter
LGANDGIVSTSSLIAGVAASGVSHREIVIGAVASWVAGAMSMAAGEYVSVSSQSDTEKADINREREHLETDPEFERSELAQIYMERGLDESLAYQVADQLMRKDPLEAHVRDELGIVEVNAPRPILAAVSSALAFSAGAIPPVIFAAALSAEALMNWLVPGTLVLLAVLGFTSSRLGGAPPMRGTLRVVFWGVIAMALASAVGRLFQVPGI